MEPGWVLPIVAFHRGEGGVSECYFLALAMAVGSEQETMPVTASRWGGDRCKIEIRGLGAQSQTS